MIFGCFGDTCTDGYDDRTNFFTFNFTRCFKVFRRTNDTNFDDRVGFAGFDDGGDGFVGFDVGDEAFDALNVRDDYGLCCTNTTRRPVHR